MGASDTRPRQGQRSLQHLQHLRVTAYSGRAPATSPQRWPSSGSSIENSTLPGPSPQESVAECNTPLDLLSSDLNGRR